jgi:aspartate aminotransferase
MTLSSLARSIKESPTLKLNAMAARLREQGEPVIHLGGGEPKSKAPADALKQAITGLQTGEVRYTPADGLPALKKAIVRYTELHYKKSVAPANVVVGSGAKQAIMSALYALLEPGDEVLYPAPYWVSYPEMVKLAGGVPVVATAADGSFQPTMNEMAAKCGPRTKVIILNSPNNPSGAMYTRDFVADMVDFCERKQIWLVMDDIYNRLVFEGRTAPNAYEFATGDLEASRLIVIQGVSKMYAMTGFRIGWAIVGRELATAMGNIQSHMTSGSATPSQWASIGALEGDQSNIDALRAALESNRNIMLERLAGIRGLRVTKPEGTFYCFPDFSTFGKSSMQLAEFLLEKVRVVVVPGNEFGMEGYLRLSYCGSTSDVTEGVERIRWALDPSAPEEIVVGGRKLVRDWK